MEHSVEIVLCRRCDQLAGKVLRSEKTGQGSDFEVGKFTPDFIEKFEYISKKSWRFDVLPVLKDGIEAPIRAEKVAKKRGNGKFSVKRARL
ncbi:hypothetical protein J2P12_03925 [Candidatus Bathyarchaeota archaeon]|nr:hypothetical protein [Candidatus Bathyarchaeota archaeon]